MSDKNSTHFFFFLYFIHDRINKYTKLMCYLVSFSSMNNSWIFIKESHDSPLNFANSVNIDFLSSDNSYFETSTQIWILRQESCGSLIGHERFRWCRWTCNYKKTIICIIKEFQVNFCHINVIHPSSNNWITAMTKGILFFKFCYKVWTNILFSHFGHFYKFCNPVKQP